MAHNTIHQGPNLRANRPLPKKQLAPTESHGELWWNCNLLPPVVVAETKFDPFWAVDLSWATESTKRGPLVILQCIDEASLTNKLKSDAWKEMVLNIRDQ
jgi:hypothetical protein